MPEYPQSLVSASPRRLSGTASLSRISTGAVLWLSPTTTICISGDRSKTLDRHTHECQHDAGESDNGQIGRTLGPPANGKPSDQDDKVEEPRHQGPCLFRIPVHIGAASEFGRDRAGDNPKREQRETQYDRLLVQIVEKIERGQLRIQHI